MTAFQIHATIDQERMASLALHHSLNSIPVIDANDRLLGIVPPVALLHIPRREHEKDFHRFAGISWEENRAREAIESSALVRLRYRLPWLLFGLLGSVLATFIMARFESALSLKPSIAFFVPGLVYLADAIGTQAEAVAVRGLSLSHAGLGFLVGGEIRTGILIGLVLGALTLPGVWLAFGDLNLALAVASALVVAGGIATTIGLFLPWLLDRLARQRPCLWQRPFGYHHSGSAVFANLLRHSQRVRHVGLVQERSRCISAYRLDPVVRRPGYSMTAGGRLQSSAAGRYRPRLCKNAVLFRFRGSSNHSDTQNNRIQRVLRGRFFSA